MLMYDMERKKLEFKYRSLFKERLELAQSVTYVLNRKEPIYNWFKYKEAFSKRLVQQILYEWKISKKDLVLDPFAGCGTTLLACKENGYNSVGVDRLPLAVFIAQTKLKLYECKDINKLRMAVEKLLKLPYRDPKEKFPNVPIIDKAFNEEVKKDILFFKEQIIKFRSPAKDFLLLGLLSILEELSFTSKDGQFLRLVERKIPPVRETLRKKFNRMLGDLSDKNLQLFKNKPGEATILLGDAKKLPFDDVTKFGAVITSPPYLNRYDYSRTYALELCTLFVNNPEDLKEIRRSLLRSHIESKFIKEDRIELSSLKEILSCLQKKKLNNNRIPIMIKGYFVDMNKTLGEVSKVVKPRGIVALVVANARFEGEIVPVDLMLSELAELHGFKTEEIWITRYKGNSSQQMARYGRLPTRESIVFWRRLGEREKRG